jgi:cation transport ATPase
MSMAETLVETGGRTGSALRYRVDGMDCPSCAAKIEKAVGRFDGVGDIRVNYGRQVLAFSLDEKLTARSARGQSVGCHADNVKGERAGNVDHATILPSPNLSGRRRSAVAAARSHRKSPEKAMCSHVSGDVWASSSSGTDLPWLCRCCMASVR